MPPAYVKPYVKRGKADASDAEAICEAVTRPTMLYVAIKSSEQQAALAIHWTRDLFVKAAHPVGQYDSGARFSISRCGCARSKVRFSPGSGRRPRQTVGDDSWYRHCLCHGSRRVGYRPAPVPFRPAVCCLARAYPATALEWRQGTAGADLKDGRQISAQTARRRHDLARSARKVQAERCRSPARPSAVAKAGSCAHGCASTARTGALGTANSRNRRPDHVRPSEGLSSNARIT
jgi:hypothetical protein